jgi:hypothetical protein
MTGDEKEEEPAVIELESDILEIYPEGGEGSYDLLISPLITSGEVRFHLFSYDHPEHRQVNYSRDCGAFRMGRGSFDRFLEYLREGLADF